MSSKPHGWADKIGVQTSPSKGVYRERSFVEEQLQLLAPSLLYHKYPNSQEEQHDGSVVEAPKRQWHKYDLRDLFCY